MLSRTVARVAPAAARSATRSVSTVLRAVTARVTVAPAERKSVTTPFAVSKRFASSKPSVAQPAVDAVQAIIEKEYPGFKPRAGIVLGSGLAPVADIIENVVRIPYSDIPGFPVSTVEGHSGELLLGDLEGVPVAALKGRVHLYEGGDPQVLRVPMYTFKLLGCETVFLTSAVGSTREEVGPGDVVAVTDHINMQMRNVLIGPNDDAVGPRFPSLMNAYDPDLRKLLHEGAEANDISMTDGVFLATLGPSFETPAEVRAYRMLGADVLGMSMIPEVTGAAHCGLRVAAVAVVVNLASGMTDGHVNHEETIFFGDVASPKVTKILRHFLQNSSRW